MSERICSIQDCAKPVDARGWCQMHYRRWQKHGDTSVVLPPSPPPRFSGADHPRWKGDEIASYGGAHLRVYGQRGAPSECENDPSHDGPFQWALDHRTATDVRMGDNHGRPTPFSPNPDDYLSLCLLCHQVFDEHPFAEVVAGA